MSVTHNPIRSPMPESSVRARARSYLTHEVNVRASNQPCMDSSACIAESQVLHKPVPDHMSPAHYTAGRSTLNNRIRKP
ncbi:hypothetical protein N7463_010331 [Penicillium fimorum]|uniref:Uncharacterized protein n=1 Tax=Penicillium fimorum TaxID=1882269 RepID=A0A9X0C1P0_9EURO|nr:hypothetical protein N7463_010331 [Penicillium fimorum]